MVVASISSINFTVTAIASPFMNGAYLVLFATKLSLYDIYEIAKKGGLHP